MDEYDTPDTTSEADVEMSVSFTVSDNGGPFAKIDENIMPPDKPSILDDFFDFLFLDLLNVSMIKENTGEYAYVYVTDKKFKRRYKYLMAMTQQGK